jgi:hypothetical protein
MDGVIKDPNLAPNHSFRHYLKSELLARDVPERISDSITGHKTPGIGRKYEHVPMSKKFDAISKLPVILLHTVRDFRPRNEPDCEQRHHGAGPATR